MPVPDTSPRGDRPVSTDTIEVAALRTAGGKVFRVGTELRIQLRDGGTAVFKDDTTGGLQFALPRYAGYLKAIHSHAIHILQYEGSGVYLAVDDSTGDSTIVVGMPVPSPDGSRFALTSREGMEGGNPGVIEVWRMVGRKPEKEFSYDTENAHWEATDAVWRDSVTIDFMKNSFVSFTEPDIQTPARLTRTGTTWVLSEPHTAPTLRGVDDRVVLLRRDYSLAGITSLVEIKQTTSGQVHGRMQVTSGDVNRQAEERTYGCRMTAIAGGTGWECDVPFVRGAPDWRALLIRLDSLGINTPPPVPQHLRGGLQSLCGDGAHWTVEVRPPGSGTPIRHASTCGPTDSQRAAFENGIGSVLDAVERAARER